MLSRLAFVLRRVATPCALALIAVAACEGPQVGASDAAESGSGASEHAGEGGAGFTMSAAGASAAGASAAGASAAGASAAGETTGGISSGGATGSGAAGASNAGGFKGLGGVPNGSCARAFEKLTSCELATGSITCGDVEADIDAPCHFGCYDLAICAELSGALCDGALNHFASCLARCQEFHCQDGSSILSSWWCDGLDDCPDAEDEVDCPEPPLCNDGSGYAPAWICNGFPDCDEGEDEVGCMFTCSDGGSIAREAVCDTTEDCSDGSDEVACVELSCNSIRVRL